MFTFIMHFNDLGLEIVEIQMSFIVKGNKFQNKMFSHAWTKKNHNINAQHFINVQ